MKRLFSKGRMLVNEDKLPNLPLEPLELTLDKYYNSLTPILSPHELSCTQKAIQDTLKFQGPQVHSALKQKNAKFRNHMTEWWADKTYLSVRDSIAVYSNFYGGINYDRPFPGARDYCEAAGLFVYGALKYKQLVDWETIEPEYLWGNPMSMVQYKKMFGVSRIPGKEIDSLKRSQSPSTIAVLRNNHIFLVPAYDSAGNMFSPATYTQMFRKVVGHTHSKDPYPLAMMTYDARPHWAEFRSRMESISPQNAQNLDLVDSSVFSVSLNDKSFEDVSELSYDIYMGEATDKWIDKSLHVVFYQDCKGGFQAEHSSAEGIVFKEMIEYAKDYFKEGVDQGEPINKQIQKLGFEYDEELKAAMKKAEQRVLDECSNQQVRVARLPFGNDFCKQTKIMTADSFVQLSYQLAWYNNFREVPPTYETAITRAFYDGRTDNVRVCSKETLAMCKLLNSNTNNDQKLEVIKKASDVHTNMTKMAMRGKGIDRPLWAHMCQAEEMGIELPIFKDPAWEKSRRFVLSTSNIGAFDTFFGYGSMYPDGIASCYTIQDKGSIHNASNFKKQRRLDARDWLKSVEKASQQIKVILESS
mmetsp:Transcript_11360/g.16782  ORF Transcript_11360/g.16782 Transcript_11360/m.16782 type:complete len:585 (-) Transcript_11360:36-1790(-)